MDNLIRENLLDGFKFKRRTKKGIHYITITHIESKLEKLLVIDSGDYLTRSGIDYVMFLKIPDVCKEILQECDKIK